MVSIVEPEVGVKVYIDGPYSAPSSEVESCQHAILVATGSTIIDIDSRDRVEGKQFLRIKKLSRE